MKIRLLNVLTFYVTKCKDQLTWGYYNLADDYQHFQDILFPCYSF